MVTESSFIVYKYSFLVSLLVAWYRWQYIRMLRLEDPVLSFWNAQCAVMTMPRENHYVVR